MIVLLALAAIAGQRHPCLLGLAVNIPVGGGVRDLTESILGERRMGCNLMITGVKWSEVEPTPGSFKLDHLRDDLANQVHLGFTPVLTLKTIDTNNRTLPADLAGEAWDSPKMVSREKSLMSAIAVVLPKGVGAVILGNEVDAYLAGHPAEIDAYIRFLAVGRWAIHNVRHDTPVGVTTMFSGLADHRDLITRLHLNMDLVSMTYYPFLPDFSVLPVGDVGKHFKQMIDFAGSKKLFIAEAGYPASPVLGSSGEKQAAFVDAVFDAMSRYGSHLYGLSYFIEVDFSDKLVDNFVAYYGLNAAKFRAMLSTLGLKDQHGVPRPAWARFQQRAIDF